MRHIEKEWEDFRQAVLIPIAANELQTWEMKKAFFSGAQALVFRLVNLFEHNGTDEPTLADLQVMNDVVSELKEFFLSLKSGQVGRA